MPCITRADSLPSKNEQIVSKTCAHLLLVTSVALLVIAALGLVSSHWEIHMGGLTHISHSWLYGMLGCGSAFSIAALSYLLCYTKRPAQTLEKWFFPLAEIIRAKNKYGVRQSLQPMEYMCVPERHGVYVIRMTDLGEIEVAVLYSDETGVCGIDMLDTYKTQLNDAGYTEHESIVQAKGYHVVERIILEPDSSHSLKHEEEIHTETRRAQGGRFNHPITFIPLTTAPRISSYISNHLTKLSEPMQYTRVLDGLTTYLVRMNKDKTVDFIALRKGDTGSTSLSLLSYYEGLLLKDKYTYVDP